jgi:hypothetical protein
MTLQTLSRLQCENFGILLIHTYLVIIMKDERQNCIILFCVLEGRQILSLKSIVLRYLQKRQKTTDFETREVLSLEHTNISQLAHQMVSVIVL